MRDIVFSMRLTQEEHAAWSKLAAAQRRSLTDYVRLTMEDQYKAYAAMMAAPVASDATVARRKAQQEKAAKNG